jgi:hypothetical protein
MVLCNSAPMPCEGILGKPSKSGHRSLRPHSRAVLQRRLNIGEKPLIPEPPRIGSSSLALGYVYAAHFTLAHLAYALDRVDY